MRELETLLRCAVCFEEYSRRYPPVTLQCGHTFCGECIHKLKKRKVFVRCPVDNINNKLTVQCVNYDFLEYYENTQDALKLPKKRPPVQERQAQCDFSDIQRIWEERYKAVKGSIYELENYIQNLAMYMEVLSWNASAFPQSLSYY